MDQNAAFTELWHVLEDIQDYVDSGYRTEHPPAPEFKVHLVRDARGQDLHPQKEEQIQETRGEVSNCRACDLHLARKQAILGQGNLGAPLMIILPPPDYDGDDNGVPLHGEALEFVQKWIEAIGMNFERDCYMTNVVKCRPPGNRPPFYEELQACRHYLQDQVDTLQPKAILLLGPSALHLVDQEPQRFDQLRGQPLQGPAPLVLCTYDPFWVLKHPQFKRPVWEDLKLLKEFMIRQGVVTGHDS